LSIRLRLKVAAHILCFNGLLDAAVFGGAVTTKLHINISQGIIDVEGDPELRLVDI
jgi:hypothetical protein